MPSKTKKTQLEDQVERIARRPYARMLIPDVEDGGYVARVLEFPGCLSEGGTPNEAIENIEEALRLVVQVMVESGQAIPEPLSAREYSGRLNLRIPPSLHARATERALVEGVSLNRLLSDAVAQRLGAALSGISHASVPRGNAVTLEADAIRLVRLSFSDGTSRAIEVPFNRGARNPAIIDFLLAAQAYWKSQNPRFTSDLDTWFLEQETWRNPAGLDVRYVYADVAMNGPIELVAYDPVRGVYCIYADMEAEEIAAEATIVR